MLPHPAIYWAKFLISQRCYTNAQLEGMMVARGLGGLSSMDFDFIRNSMTYPQPYFPQLARHAKSSRFLQEQQIYELWHPTVDMKAASAILDHPRLRKLVEAFLLSPFPPEAALRRLNKELEGTKARSVNLETYRLYQHYFWCSEFMSGVDWGAFIENNRAAEQNWASLAVNVTGENGARLLLWKMGLGSPRHIDAHVAFQDALKAAALDVAQVMSYNPSVEKTRILLGSVRVIEKAHAGMELTGGAQESLQAAFQGFALKQVTPDITPVRELTMGRLSIPELGRDDADGPEDFILAAPTRALPPAMDEESDDDDYV